MSSADAFDRFWTASELDRSSRQTYARRIADRAADGGPHEVEPFVAPGRRGEPIPLARPAGSPHLDPRRRSTRTFGGGQLDLADLGALLEVLTVDEDGRRGYPSAGASYAVRVAALMFRGDAAGRVLLHDPVRHEVSDVGPCPDWAELRDDLGGQDARTAPAAMLALFADPGTVTATYGERGGRFLLIEAGAVAQTLGLAAARLGLVGFLLGAQLDARLLGLAGLASTDARSVVGYAVGPPPEPEIVG